MHEQTVEDLFPSSVVAAQTATVGVCLNIEPTTSELEVSTPLCDEHVCGDSSPYRIRNDQTFQVFSQQEARDKVFL